MAFFDDGSELPIAMAEFTLFVDNVAQVKISFSFFHAPSVLHGHISFSQLRGVVVDQLPRAASTRRGKALISLPWISSDVSSMIWAAR